MQKNTNIARAVLQSCNRFTRTVQQLANRAESSIAPIARAPVGPTARAPVVNNLRNAKQLFASERNLTMRTLPIISNNGRREFSTVASTGMSTGTKPQTSMSTKPETSMSMGTKIVIGTAYGVAGFSASFVLSVIPLLAFSKVITSLNFL